MLPAGPVPASGEEPDATAWRGDACIDACLVFTQVRDIATSGGIRAAPGHCLGSRDQTVQERCLTGANET